MKNTAQRRIPHKLELGKEYIIRFNNRNGIHCKLIKPTRCGYNFLNLQTSKCILTRSHIYPSKCENHESGDWFFLSDKITIKHCW